MPALWESFIGSTPTAHPFVMFSQQHYNVLIISAVCIMLSLYLCKHSSELVNRYIRYGVAAFILTMELLFQYWHVHIGNFDVGRDLPFDLCTITQMIIIILMIKPNRYWSQIMVFWAFSGALQALLTPGFEYAYNFPHFRFFNYFVCHAVIIWSACYFVYIQGFRPHFKSMVRSFFWLNVLALIVTFVNLATNGNYMFLCFTPPTGSLLDYFGPWPWYILGSELMAAVMFAVIYSPFAAYDYAKKRYGTSANDDDVSRSIR